MEEKVEEYYLHIIAGFKYESRVFGKDRGQEEAQKYLALISKLAGISYKFIPDGSESLRSEKPCGTSLGEGILSTSSDIISHSVFGSLYQVQLVLTGTKEYLKSCSAATVEERDVSYHKISMVNRATLDVTIGFDNNDDTSEGLVSDYVSTFFKENDCNNLIKDPYYECGELDAGRIDATAAGPIRAILILQGRLASYVKPRRDSWFKNNSVVYHWQDSGEPEKAKEKEGNLDEESPRLHERYEAE